MGTIDQAFNSQEIAVACPKCSHQTKEKIGRLRSERHVTCAGCGTDITVDTSQLEQALGSAQRGFDDLTRSLSKTIKLKF